MDYASLVKEVDIPKLIKALRICSSELNCGDCPLLYRDSCSSDELMNDAAAAIEELQAVLKEADKKQAYQHDCICELTAENAELQDELDQWKGAVKGQEDGIKVLQAEVERLQVDVEAAYALMEVQE